MKAKELAQLLLAEIEKGTYTKLPTEEQLIETYSLTRYCVRQAINILVESGRVYIVQGSGVYARENKAKGCLNLSSTKGITKEFEGKQIRSKCIEISEQLSDKALSKSLECPEFTKIYKIVRIRYVDEQPLAIEYAYYKQEFVPYLNQEIVENSIYKYLIEALKLNIGFADKIIEAKAISELEADYLELNPNDPAIVIKDSVYLRSGEIFNLSEVVYNYKLAKFFDLATFKK